MKVSLLFGCVGLFLAGSLPGKAQAIDTESLRADKRLLSPVTLKEPGATFHDLLQQLQNQTGVSLQVEDEDPDSGITALVYVRNQPLRDTLNALWSLVSYRGAGWEWVRTGKPENYVYTLVHTHRAKALSALLQRKANEVADRHIQEILRIARLNPSEWSAQLKSFASSILLQDDEKWAKVYLHDARLNQVRAYALATTPLQQRLVSRGEKVTMLVSEMPEEAQMALKNFWKVFNPLHRDESGQNVPVPYPEKISFQADYGRSSLNPSMLPVYWMKLGEINTSFMGGDILEAGWYRLIEKTWTLKEEAAASPREKSPVPVVEVPLSFPSENPAFAKKPDLTPQQEKLKRLAEASEFPILALLDNSRMSYSSASNKTLLAYLNREEPVLSRLGLMKKWRGDFLLLSYPEWYPNRDNTLPYALIRNLEKWNRQHKIPVQELVSLANSLSAESWLTFARLHPEFQQTDGVLPLLRLCAQFPDLTRPNGKVLEGELRQNMAEALKASLPAEPAQIRVKLQNEVLGSRRKIVSSLVVETLDLSRTWKVLSRQTAYEFPSKEKGAAPQKQN